MADTEKFDVDSVAVNEIANSPDISESEYEKMSDSLESDYEDVEAVASTAEKPYLDVTDEERQTTDLVAKALKNSDDAEVKDEILNTLILHLWAKFKDMGKGGWFYIGSLGLVASLMYRKEIAHAWLAVWGFFNKRGELK